MVSLTEIKGKTDKMTGLLTQTKTQQFPNEYMGSIALQSY